MKLLSRIAYKLSKILSILKLRKKTILILKLDGIGDYILFRNFIEEIKRTNGFRQKKIVLCGNVLWKDIAIDLDCNSIDRFIWVEKKQIDSSFNLYTKKTLFWLNLSYYEMVFHPTFSRDYISEFIIQNIFSPNKITMLGDDAVLPKDIINNYYKNYKEIINVGKSNDFDFYKNKIFIEKILKKNIDIKRPIINLKQKQIEYKDHIVVYIGASHKDKKWDYVNFSQLIQNLSNFNDYKFILCGGKDDRPIANKIAERCKKNDVINIVGATSLSELLNIIANARFVITNDTGIVHISGALDIRTFCLYRGEFMGRFQPYPEQMNSTITTIMKDPCFIKEYFEKQITTGLPYDINDITVDQVFSVILKNIKNNENTSGI